MRIKLGALLLVSMVIATTVRSQSFTGIRENGILRSADVVKKYQEAFKGFDPPSIKGNDIRLLRVRYLTANLKGRQVTVSGLVAMPSTGAPKGVVIFYHGTLADRESVPSRYNGQKEIGDAHFPVLAFVTAGYVVAFPDYLGLGDEKSFHPYPLMKVHAQSGIDMVKPTRALAGKYGVKVGKDLFVSGYSQGGSVAMWATRILQDRPQFGLVSSSALSGPYDLSGVQMQQVLEKTTSIVPVAVRAFLVSYLVYSLEKNRFQVRTRDYFVPSFASYVPVVFGRNLKDDKILQQLTGKAVQLGSIRSLDRITNADARKRMLTQDRKDPLIKFLSQNNSFDWTPKVPLYLACIDGDAVVTPKNMARALESMRRRGVGVDKLRGHTIRKDKLNHVSGYAPALLLARRFFDEGFAGVPSDK